MEALTLDRKTYEDALDYVNNGLPGASYLAQFSVTFPDGLNTANTLEICRVINAPTFENKVHLMKVCIQGRNVEVKCPNGEIEKFNMSKVDNSFDGFPLFQKDPLALTAIADAIYGYILKNMCGSRSPRKQPQNKRHKGY